MKLCPGDCERCGRCPAMPVLDRFRAVGGREPRQGLGIAADIGTTTVVLALLDLQSGELLARSGFLNPQRKFGADVLSRVAAGCAGAGEELKRLIADAAAAGMEALLARHPGGELTEVAVAGNTVMTHLLLGLDAGSLGVYPFRPQAELPENLTCRGVFGLPDRDCPVRVLPWLAAFDGGDVAAGLLSVLPEGLERFLLLDLGTNGELALYDRGRLTVTAAAAGPAFEGSSRGGGASAVLDDLAKLRREGALDASGLLAAHAPDWFTQKEVRDLQLAKSAVRAGLELLLDTAGLRYEELDAVYLAGGIGQAMNPESAYAIGLLPPGGTVRAVGNASLGGAVRLLLAPRSANADLQRIRSSCTELNLAAHPRFQMFFVEHLEL